MLYNYIFNRLPQPKQYQLSDSKFGVALNDYKTFFLLKNQFILIFFVEKS
jgi:hypothetical protein